MLLSIIIYKKCNIFLEVIVKNKEFVNIYMHETSIERVSYLIYKLRISWKEENEKKIMTISCTTCYTTRSCKAS